MKNADKKVTNSQHALKRISALAEKLTQAQKQIQTELQQLLDELEGCAFGSLDANVSVANAIRNLTLRLEVRVKCVREGCHKPSLLRARPAGRSRDGSFVFEHRLKGRIMAHAGRTHLPKMHLVPAPPDRRQKQNKE